MIDRTHIKSRLTIREKVVLWLVLLMIRIIAPWQYEHQAKEIISEIVNILKGEGEG